MSVHLFTVTLQSSTELPADAMVNTFYFEGGGSDPDNVGDMLYDFYNVQPTDATFSIAELFTTQALTGVMDVKGYDLAQPRPRAPMFDEQYELEGLGVGEALPTEVALCLSYRAEYASGVPAARRRGRIYLGGFQAGFNTQGRPTASARTTMATSARDLLQAANSAVSWEWQQYSQTLGVGTQVVAGWVDDAWDTQRRRGLPPSQRTTWTATTPI